MIYAMLVLSCYGNPIPMHPIISLLSVLRRISPSGSHYYRPTKTEVSFHKGAMCCVMWRLAGPLSMAIEIGGSMVMPA